MFKNNSYCVWNTDSMTPPCGYTFVKPFAQTLFYENSTFNVIKWLYKYKAENVSDG